MKGAVAALAALLVAAGAGACAQIAGVQEVTFTSEHDASTLPADARAAPRTDAGVDGDDGGPSSPTEDCPSCGGASCCSPKHCSAGGACCTGRGEPCATSADCCDGECDVDAGRCTGACLPTGGSPCVTNGDCCEGTCNSAGKCEPCAAAGGGCTADQECCFGLSCTSTEAGTCMQL